MSFRAQFLKPHMAKTHRSKCPTQTDEKLRNSCHARWRESNGGHQGPETLSTSHNFIRWRIAPPKRIHRGDGMLHRRGKVHVWDPRLRIFEHKYQGLQLGLTLSLRNTSSGTRIFAVLLENQSVILDIPKQDHALLPSIDKQHIYTIIAYPQR